MKNYRLRLWGLLAVASVSLSAPLAIAEIYKWVDAEGKVHFGDKPNDPAQAAQAQEVEIKESYRPTQRTPQEQDAYIREQQLLRQKTEARQQFEQKGKDEKAAQRREQKAKLCAAYADEIKRFTTLDLSGPIPKYYYIIEDGKSVTSERQREIIAELKAEMAAAGCP